MKKMDKVTVLKLASVAAGFVLLVAGLVMMLATAPEITKGESAGCEADGLCNCNCPGKLDRSTGEKPDPDCSSFGQTLSVILLFLALMVGVVPITGYEYFRYSRFKRMEDSFPRFMKDFSEAVKGGMTIPQALTVTAKIDYGPLSREIKKADHQVSWGVPFPKAMMRFAERIKGSSIMKQSFTIINESFRSGGDIASTMNSIAMNIGLIKEIEDEKKSIMSQQIYIMYFIFFLFLVIIVMLYKMIVPMLSMDLSGGKNPIDPSANCHALGLPSEAMCSVGGALGFGCEHVYFVSLFLSMCLVQSVSIGLLAGIIGEGKIAAGIKHMAIMLTATLSVFLIFV